MMNVYAKIKNRPLYDGKLMGENIEEVNFAELLQVARDDFDPTHQTVDESRLLSEWPQIRHQFRQAAIAWDASLTTTMPVQLPINVAEQTSTPPRIPDNIIPFPKSAPRNSAWRLRMKERASRLRELIELIDQKRRAVA